MVTALNAFVEIGMFFAFIALIYCIIQIIDVIREERERLMWLKQGRQPVKADDDLDNAN